MKQDRDDIALPANANGTHAENIPPFSNPIMGMFSDAPDLMDEVIEDAMRIREERPWRRPAGESRST